jgi:hypothetical protein
MSASSAKLTDYNMGFYHTAVILKKTIVFIPLASIWRVFNRGQEEQNNLFYSPGIKDVAA